MTQERSLEESHKRVGELRGVARGPRDRQTDTEREKRGVTSR